LFFFGPGIGESIVVQLPSGEWGVVDCYAQSSSEANGVLAFLKEKRVPKLAFFCLTHPHADHFTGSHWLLREYEGKVDRIWRHPGFSSRDITARLLLAGKVKSRRTQDPEPEEQVNEYARVLHAIDRAKRSLPASSYRRVIAPLSLMREREFEISAVRPTSAMLDSIEARLAKHNPNKGFSFLDDQDGAILNSLSVVILIEFGDTRVCLLGDAQGARDRLHDVFRTFSTVKIAHHGSANGFGAAALGHTSSESRRISCGVITPYLRSRLPTPEMVARYKSVCEQVFLTGGKPDAKTARIIPGVKNAQVVTAAGPWVAVQISKDGKVDAISI